MGDSMVGARGAVRSFWIGVSLLVAGAHAWAGCDPRTLSDVEQNVVKAYIAYYGRIPDAAGLAWWAETLAAQGGELASIMQAFGTSEEFENRFGPLTTETLVNNLYVQAFARSADAAGLQWYVEELAAGRTTLQTVALDILNGAQNEDAEVIANRVTVSAHAVTLFEDAGVVLTESALQEGLQDVTAEIATLPVACDALGEAVSEEALLNAAADAGSEGQACDNGSVDTEPVKQIGYLTGVSGMSYASESVASLDGVKKTITGETSDTGAYEYYDLCGASSVTTYCLGVKKGCATTEVATGVLLSDLSKGSRVVGQVPSQSGYLSLEDTVALSYPAESEAVQQEIGRNLFRLLFSLDEDSDASNGVTMTARIRAETEQVADRIDLSQSGFENNEEVLALVQRASQRTALVQEEVQQEFAQSLDRVKSITAQQEGLKAFLGYFGKPVDPVVSRLWQQRLLNDPNALTELMAELGKTEAFTRQFSGLNGEEIVDALSQRLFNRKARALEKQHWLALFEAGSLRLNLLPAEMARAPYLTQLDKTTLGNKLEVMNHFYQTWGTRAYESSLDSPLAGIISKVNDSAESVIQAVAEMNELIGGSASTGGLTFSNR